MSKSGMTGMGLHQALSFFPFMMQVPKAEAVFWPGCALMNLDGVLLERTLSVLRRAEPQMQLCTCCCSQPSVYLFPEKAKNRQEQLLSLLKKQGVQRIYTACPNCTIQLRVLGLEVFSIWPILAKYLRKGDILSCSGSYVWHDPCATKKDAEQQKAVRELLKLSGCDYCEPKHSGCHTICCGNFHMMHTLHPETSAEMRKCRLEEFPKDCKVLSSCEGCLGSFRGEGKDGKHLLELLFGDSKQRGWSNRIKTTMKQK